MRKAMREPSEGRKSSGVSRCPRLVVVDQCRGAEHVVDAVAAALREGSDTLVLEPLNDATLAGAHAVIVADTGVGGLACARVGPLRETACPRPIVGVVEVFDEGVATLAFRAGVHAWAQLPLAPSAFAAQLESLAAALIGEPDPPDVAVEMDALGGTVRVEGRPIALNARAFAVFVYLYRRREIWVRSQRVVEDVFEASHVGSGVLRNQIAKIREALGEELAWIVQSCEKRGFRITLSRDSSAGRRGLPHPRYRGSRTA